MRMRVAINLSVHQLREDDLVARITDALRRHGIAPSQLLCEITESIAMEDIATTQRAFDDLSRLGVFLSIDDFGTGYSSLSYLRRLPAQQLKIDRSFVGDLASSSDARAIVDAVVRLAHALGLKVVAEGVETAGQRDILLELGCDELQGYFFARPMPAADLLAWALSQGPDGNSDFSPSVMQELSTF
jgi:EAL domain-containing protein (putative c-di-GMP-specific phosphodiesterase class I)